MIKPATPAAYMRKAERAPKGARVLLGAADAEGACNRAYYAMFDAAHAVLHATGLETADAEIKTHNGLITIFTKEMVRTKRVDAAYSKALNQVQQLRQVADYLVEPPDLDKAAWAVEQAELFVAAMTTVIEESSRSGGRGGPVG